jgi:hypothetical protein
LTPFCNRSLDVGENTNEFNHGFNSHESLTSRVTQLNKVCVTPKEKTMKRGRSKKLETKKGEILLSIPSWESPPS